VGFESPSTAVVITPSVIVELPPPPADGVPPKEHAPPTSDRITIIFIINSFNLFSLLGSKQITGIFYKKL
jgi:hypothetical protein